VDPLQRTPARSTRSRLALAAVKVMAWGGLLGFVVASGSVGTSSATPDHAGSSPAPSAQAPECEAALIRTADGAVRRVTFRVGWDVYTGRRPGTLIAACLDTSGR
jgi:hypothetical protein